MNEDLARNNRPAIESMFSPASVALIGATESPGSVGRSLAENLLSFDGPVHFINPNKPRILGKETLPSITAIGAPVDLAVIATKAETVPQIVRDCAEAGVRGAIIISAGFKETGAHGVDLERQITAAQGAMRIIGPNCVGIMSPHAGLNATFAQPLALPGSIGFISQSGALCTGILDWSLNARIGFSAFVSIGSMLDLDWGDVILHLGDDPNTHSILLYMESIGNARSFLSAAREVALKKPVIVIKAGRTEAAAKAAVSHTGALTGSDEVCDAAFRRAGVLRVNTIAELFNMAELLGKQPRARGPRLAIVTNGGGPGALAIDALDANGGTCAALSPESLEALNRVLPPHWSRGNPVDVIGDAGPERYAQAVEIVARDPENDGVLVVLTPQSVTDPEGVAQKLTAFARLEGKPVLVSFMGGVKVAEARKILEHAGMSTFPYPDSAARAFCHLWEYSRALGALYETPALASGPENSAARDKCALVIDGVSRAGRTLLTEIESKEIFAAYGIPATPTVFAAGPDEAVQEALRFGGPVVMKVHSHGITHKTDVGGVKLNLNGEAAVRAAYQQMEQSVRGAGLAAEFLGVTIQPMIKTEGWELILGSSMDPQFGPVLLFGAGGQWVEIFKDSALGLPPLNRTLARRMIERTLIHHALKGARGRKPVDEAALEALLVRFSQMVVEQPRIKEIDINPLLVSAEQIVALDARVVLHPASVADADLPHPAIRPYPAQYVSTTALGDGTRITVRPIRPEDEPAMVKFHEGLSEQSVHFRFFGAMSLENRTRHERLVHICFNDYDREIALVAEHAEADKAGEILGVARLSRAQEPADGVFVILISDAWQGRGLGAELLGRLVEAGRAEKFRLINGRVLPDNAAMLEICRRAGFDLQWSEGDGEWKAEIVL